MKYKECGCVTETGRGRPYSLGIWGGLAGPQPSFSMRSSKSSGPPQLSTRFVSQTFQAKYEPSRPSNKSLSDNSKQNQICQNFQSPLRPGPKGPNQRANHQEVEDQNGATQHGRNQH